MPAWLTVCLIYVVWNICGYLERELFPNSVWADYAYWINERLFVVATFCFMVHYLRRSVFKLYVWLAKTLVIIALLKLIYVILVAMNLIRINQGWQIIGFFFIIALGYIIVRWEKRQ